MDCKATEVHTKSGDSPTCAHHAYAHTHMHTRTPHARTHAHTQHRSPFYCGDRGDVLNDKAMYTCKHFICTGHMSYLHQLIETRFNNGQACGGEGAVMHVINAESNDQGTPCDTKFNFCFLLILFSLLLFRSGSSLSLPVSSMQMSYKHTHPCTHVTGGLLAGAPFKNWWSTGDGIDCGGERVFQELNTKVANLPCMPVYWNNFIGSPYLLSVSSFLPSFSPCFSCIASCHFLSTGRNSLTHISVIGSSMGGLYARFTFLFIVTCDLFAIV